MMSRFKRIDKVLFEVHVKQELYIGIVRFVSVLVKTYAVDAAE
jgi:hypothetical protein